MNFETSVFTWKHNYLPGNMIEFRNLIYKRNYSTGKNAGF